MKYLENTFQGMTIRTNVDENGNVWFASQDVMQVLDIKSQAHALRKIDAADRGEMLIQGNGGIRKLASVNESGLYTLVLASRKKNAEEFRRWVTKDVLPSIRKTGSYSIQRKEMSPLDILENHVKQMRALEAANQNMAKHIKEVELIAKQDDDTLTSDQIATLDDEISKRIHQLGHRAYAGFIKGKIKKTFFKIQSSRTYKEIARRDFDRAIILVKNFQPENWMKEKILDLK